MTEILIKAEDATHSDAEMDRAGSYKKGYPVVVMPDDHTWGSQEGLPKFVIIKCPQLALSGAQNYIDQYVQAFDYVTISANQAQDIYAVRVSASNVNSTGHLDITKDQVERYLSGWNCDLYSASTNKVVFILDVYQLLISERFWEANITNFDFTKVSYTSATGAYDISASYPISNSIRKVESKVELAGGTVVSSSSGKIRFTINRSTAIQALKEDLKRLGQKVAYRRQYYFDPADVDTVIANGGIMTLNKTQLLNKIKNKVND
jgi:hypothetical protein